jgi:hypothetical protein
LPLFFYCDTVTSQYTRCTVFGYLFLCLNIRPIYFPLIFFSGIKERQDTRGRIHSWFNISIKTGRLLSSQPNISSLLETQRIPFEPYKGFIAEEGNTLIVADYELLELRLLAHITDCKSMIQAFKEGGCFHSRTAIGMYPHVARLWRLVRCC